MKAASAARPTAAPCGITPRCYYLHDSRALFDKLEFSEKQIEISLGDGVTVNGRIDLVRCVDMGETTIVDLKLSDRAQPEEVTEPRARQGSPHADREGCRRLCADPNSPRRRGNN